MSRQPLLGLMAVMIGVTAGGCQRSEGSGDAPPATLPSLPDWSGAWATDFNGMGGFMQALEKTLKPELLGKFRGTFQTFFGNAVNFRELNCRPYVFGGFNEGFEGLIEFLFTPGRVTLVWEGGLVRRIYTAGPAPEEDLDASTAVSSIGRWVDQTLLIETRLNPNAAPLVGNAGSALLRLGQGARMSERIHLKDRDTLQIDTVLDAPAALTGTAKVTTLYRRVPGYYMGNYTTCPASDRGLDARSGHARLDLTPPADLPPPPEE